MTQRCHHRRDNVIDMLGPLRLQEDSPVCPEAWRGEGIRSILGEQLATRDIRTGAEHASHPGQPRRRTPTTLLHACQEKTSQKQHLLRKCEQSQKKVESLGKRSAAQCKSYNSKRSIFYLHSKQLHHTGNLGGVTAGGIVGIQDARQPIADLLVHQNLHNNQTNEIDENGDVLNNIKQQRPVTYL